MQDFEFVNTVAHDLKSPIGAVRGFLDLLQLAGPVNERQQHYIQRMLMGLQHMEHLVLNLLNYTRVESGVPLELETFDLRDIVQQGLELLESTAVQREITITLDKPRRPVNVTGDARMLQQVIVNLLSNAIKYNEPQGRIHISVGVGGEGARSDEAFVRVEDTGMGISPDDLPHVFERFYRGVDTVEKRIEGTGLGLAIVKGIVQRHQGQIWVESKVGVGSVFTFTIPRQLKIKDGESADGDSPLHPSKRYEGLERSYDETPSEERDAVDDNLQEAKPRKPDTDSRGDQV